MNSRTPRDSQKLLTYLGLITLAGGIVYQSGVLTNRVDELTARVAKIEATNAANTEALNSINLRGARNEAKLDFLVAGEVKEKR